MAEAMKNPSADVSVKDLNENCKLVARAMKIATSLLNKAVKAGVVQNSDAKAVDKAEPAEGEAAK